MGAAWERHAMCESALRGPEGGPTPRPQTYIRELGHRHLYGLKRGLHLTGNN